MIDHIMFGVLDFARSLAFYDQALAPLALQRIYTGEVAGASAAAYGATAPGFWIAGGDPTQGKLHIAFTANSLEAVNNFYREALLAGGEDNGAPGHRPYHPGYYGAFVRDPDGHNIEAVFLDASVDVSAAIT